MELLSATTSVTKSAPILALRSDCWKAMASAMLSVLRLAMKSERSKALSPAKWSNNTKT